MTTHLPTESRDKILAGAKRLFVTEGYHGLSMRQIAEAVQISKAGIYHHFKDKEDLFVAVLETYLEDLEHMVQQAWADGPDCRARIGGLARRILTQPDDQRALIRLAHQELGHLSDTARRGFGRTYHQKFINQVEAMIQSGVETGELRPLNPTMAGWTLLGMMFPYFYPSSSLAFAPPADVVEQMLTIYFDGIATSKGPSYDDRTATTG